MKFFPAILTLFLLTAVFCKAQDTIVKKDSSIIACKIIRIDQKDIYYKSQDIILPGESKISRSEVLSYYRTVTAPATQTHAPVKKEAAAKTANADSLGKTAGLANAVGVATSMKDEGPSAKTRAHSDSPDDVTSLGVGVGLDYGVFGANLTLYPIRNVGLFAGGGYALAGFGYNVGLKARYLASDAYVNPFISAMYGCNTIILVTNGSTLNKMFYAPTLGIGFEGNGSRRKSGYWSFSILVPIRGNEPENYMNELRNKYKVEFREDLWPVSFSLGYRFILN